MLDKKSLNEDNIFADIDEVKDYLYECSTEVEITLKEMIAKKSFCSCIDSIAKHWTDGIQDCPEYDWNIELIKQAIKELEEELEGKRPLNWLEHWENKY